jgi:rod shape-determining protein MreC
MPLSRPLTWTLSLLFIGLVALGISRIGAADPLQSLAERIASPFAAGIHAISAPVADFVDNVGSYGGLRKENRDLRAENERLNAEVNQLREEQAQSAQLAALNQTAQLFPDADFATANVIARDPSNIHDAVLIDKGTNDGVMTGMVVLGKEGALIGTVSKALSTTAWIRLITDPDSDVNAAVQETRAMAIVSGGLGHKLQMGFVAEGTDVKPGDTVVTSGLGGNFPKSILIGKVSKVEGSPTDLFQRIQVDPAVHPGTLETVLVMTSFVPSRLDTSQ